MDTTQEPTVLSLCTGYGGIERGLSRAIGGVRVLAHVEIEAFAIANLVAKMESGEMDPAPIWTDLKTLPLECFSGVVDILTGGYPCQPFSAAGSRKGTDDPRHLWPWIRGAVDAIRPGWCFFENVEGHITLGLRDVLDDLGRMGYRTTWGIFSAAETGAPHRRKRVFIMAHATGARWETLGYEPIQEQPAGSIGEPSKLAPPTSRQPRQSQARNGGQDTSGGSEDTQWPAGPSQPQYDWEEPRVVADTPRECGERTGPPREEGRGEPTNKGTNMAEPASKRRKRDGTVQMRDYGNGIQGNEEDGAGIRGELEGCGEPQSCRETLSKLGGATNGPAGGVDPTANRVDRLRLLGNGVVSQTAALAWSVLYKRLMGDR